MRCCRVVCYLIGCYDAEEEGHFRPHRDNTTKGTAHRRFAVSLYLNSGEYEGGWLRFPEFGAALYSAPLGGAVVFACSLLHEALPVTRGRRFMFLPFLYDEAAKQKHHFICRARLSPGDRLVSVDVPGEFYRAYCVYSHDYLSFLHRVTKFAEGVQDQVKKFFGIGK